MPRSLVRAFVALALSLGLSSPAAATDFAVDAGAACPGLGTPGAPFCTIAQGAAAAGPGDTVNVAPGVYREHVTPPASGAPGLPIVYRATGPGVRVLGTDDLSDPALWTAVSATAWSTPYDPDTNPRQVFIDGARLTEVTDLASLVLNSFFYDAVAEVLTVDIGGANPGTHDVEAGARSFGFDVNGRSDLVVQGFQVGGQNNSAIRVHAGTHVAILDNRAFDARLFGIVAEGDAATLATAGPVEISGNEAEGNGDGGLRLRTGVTNATVSGNSSHDNGNHGLFASETTDSTIEGNEFFRNARPGGVSTTGLLLDAGSHRIQVLRNRAFENQDSGFQVTGGTLGGVLVRNQDNVLVRNLSYENGDHGFDNRESDGTRLISNTAFGNTNDGFSIEGNCAGMTLANNIGANNGIATGGNDLFVATGSTSGFTSDYDVWWNTRRTTAHKIEFDGVEYDTVAAFRDATGNEVHGSGLDPRLANPSAGDFHPGAGSSALDAANAAAPSFQALDLDGRPPVDLPSVPNTGAGSPDFADRGALERNDRVPVARLKLVPKKIFVGGTVLAFGLFSTDDIGIVQYRFDWGDGTSTTQKLPIAAHRYDQPGLFHVRLTVTDGSGQSASTEAVLQVRELGPKPPKPGKPSTITICHRPPGNPGNAHTLEIGESAWPAHAAHGDYRGACHD